MLRRSVVDQPAESTTITGNGSDIYLAPPSCCLTDIVEVPLAGLHLSRVLLAEVALGEDVRLPERSVVVEVDLRG